MGVSLKHISHIFCTIPPRHYAGLSSKIFSGSYPVFSPLRCPPVEACIVDLFQNHINLTPWHYKLEMPISATSLNIFPLTIKDAIVKGSSVVVVPTGFEGHDFFPWGSAWEGSYFSATLSFEPSQDLMPEKIEFPHVSTGNHSWSLLVGRQQDIPYFEWEWLPQMPGIHLYCLQCSLDREFAFTSCFPDWCYTMKS